MQQIDRVVALSSTIEEKNEAIRQPSPIHESLTASTTLQYCTRLAVSATASKNAPTINLSQLRMLAYIAQRINCERADLYEQDGSLFESTDKRLSYLARHDLIEIVKGDHYHDRYEYSVSEIGKILLTACLNQRSIETFIHHITHAMQLTTSTRDSPINMAQVQILDYFCNSNAKTIMCFLSELNIHRQSARSRLKYLTQNGYLNKEEAFNRGGNTHANHYTCTRKGRALCGYLLGNC